MTDSTTTSRSKIWLYFIVFLTGASVMVIELLGTRLIAPFYGASLYVWSSLISVTMIALAVGYFVGGRWADRAQRSGLSLIIALAALFTLADSLGSASGTIDDRSLGFTWRRIYQRTGAVLPQLDFARYGRTVCDQIGDIAIGWRW